MGADAPTSGLDLWSSEVLVDPWDHFREIRDAAPAVSPAARQGVKA